MQRPRIVMLSTHGFFLEEPETKPEDRPALALYPAVRRKPGRSATGEPAAALRTGAGRGQPAAEASGPEDEDGILTGLEIVGTDLRGTELVVLSACETGWARCATARAWPGSDRRSSSPEPRRWWRRSGKCPTGSRRG